MEHDKDSAEARVERAILALRRRRSRATLARQAHLRPDSYISLAPAMLSVLDVIEEQEEAGVVSTTTSVAQALEIDQPRASRLVAQVVEKGLIRREADRADARRTFLVFTEVGRRYMTGVHSFRRGRFALVLNEWPPETQELFASLLSEFVENSDRLRNT